MIWSQQTGKGEGRNPLRYLVPLTCVFFGETLLPYNTWRWTGETDPRSKSRKETGDCQLKEQSDRSRRNVTWQISKAASIPWIFMTYLTKKSPSGGTSIRDSCLGIVLFCWVTSPEWQNWERLSEGFALLFYMPLEVVKSSKGCILKK